MRKRVRSIVHNESGVTVKCADGSEFEGDVVVGADGIRSIVKDEMHRHMTHTGHGAKLEGKEGMLA